MFMVYLDLDELPRVLRRTPAVVCAAASARVVSPRGLPRRPAHAAAQAVRELVAERTGVEPDGPIRLLTHLRYFGHCFNPVSFYYCYDAAGEHVRAVVAHVTNTPWGERHAYVMQIARAADHGTVALMGAQFEKALHVSPLMGMDHIYDWRLTEPGRAAVGAHRVPAHRRRERVRRDALARAPRAQRPRADPRARCATRS